MILVILFGVSINYNLNREVGNIKKKNLSTRFACCGSQLVQVMGRDLPLATRPAWRPNATAFGTRRRTCSLKNSPPDCFSQPSQPS